MIPDGGARDDFDDPLRAAVPVGNSQPLSGRLRISQTLSERWKAFAGTARPSHGSSFSRRCWREKPGIVPEPADQANTGSHCVKEANSGEAAVGDRDEATIRQPSGNQKQHLSRAVEQRLVASSLVNRRSF